MGQTEKAGMHVSHYTELKKNKTKNLFPNKTGNWYH